MDDYSRIYRKTKHLSVLFAEDDAHFQKETTEILRYFFHDVNLADDGKDALDKYLTFYREKSKYYDLVITDINMPKMNGIELSQSIYRHNEHQPIVVISAHNESHYLIELINTGVEHFMMKPMEYQNVIEVLEKVAGKISDNQAAGQKQPSKKEVEKIMLDKKTYWHHQKAALFHDGDKVKLTKKEILLMQLLIYNASKVTTNDMIFDCLWSDDPSQASLNALQPIISRFRKKLPKNSIENVYGFGYRLNL